MSAAKEIGRADGSVCESRQNNEGVDYRFCWRGLQMRIAEFGCGSNPQPGVAFDLQPTLKGSLIELRPLTREDFDQLFAAASDPLIWEQHPENDRYTREVFQKYFDGAIESKGAFAIIERISGRMIGSSRYCNLDPAESEVEIGWTFLERAFWGGSYNRELKTLMLDHAFQFVDRVVFVVGEKNLRSQKALEKIGATLLRKKQIPTADSAGPAHLVFALTRSRNFSDRSVE